MANEFTRGRPNKSGKSFSENSTSHTKDSSNFFAKPGTRSIQKKNFDKKKWRTQKYSNKIKVEEWSEKRKEYYRHGYEKEKKKTDKFDVQKIYEEEERRAKQEDSNEEDVEIEKPKKKTLPERIAETKAEKEKRREEFLKKKAEKEEAMKQYKKEKIERYKKLNKKTKKGQPIMKGRLEYLLEKIQKSM